VPRASFLRALTHRNFRLFFAGQTLSLIGTWAQSTAMPLLVYRLTNSAYLLGLVGFAAQLPSFFLTPFAGVIADRVNRKHLLIVTQAAAMVQAFGLAALVAFGDVQVWQIVLFNLTLNAINAFDMTARQAFLGDMLDDRQDLAYAISLNSSIVQLARLFGPYLAAWLIYAWGEAACFFINGLSFIAVLAALAAMRIPPIAHGRAHEPILAALVTGAAYVRHSPPIRTVLLLVTVVSVVGLPYSVLLPVFNDRILHGDAVSYGHLLLSIGVGALIASIYLGMRGIRGVLARIEIAPVGLAISLIGFSLTRSQWPAAAWLAGVGFFVMLLINSCNTLIQAIVADEMRGRVMSFYALGFLGTSPLSSLLAGTTADKFGLATALQFAGAASGICGLVYLWRSRVWKADLKRQLRAQRLPPPEPTTPPSPGYVGESLTPAPGSSA
jgi:MFS family permease